MEGSMPCVLVMWLGHCKDFIADINQMFTTNRFHITASNYTEECEFRGVTLTTHHPVPRRCYSYNFTPTKCLQDVVLNQLSTENIYTHIILY
jgi:hypothetical protein